MSDARTWQAEYEEKRAALLASHDDGAAEALRYAYETKTNGHGYMAYEVIDIEETLTELAENGWRLTRVPVPGPLREDGVSGGEGG